MLRPIETCAEMAQMTSRLKYEAQLLTETGHNKYMTLPVLESSLPVQRNEDALTSAFDAKAGILKQNSNDHCILLLTARGSFFLNSPRQILEFPFLTATTQPSRKINLFQLETVT